MLQERLRYRYALPPCARGIRQSIGNHRLTVRWALNEKQTAIVILRHPFARLHSAYEYWSHGSALYPRNVTAPPSPFPNFAAFAHALADRHDSLHRKSRNIVSGRDADHPAVWYVHFLRQTFWTEYAANR